MGEISLKAVKNTHDAQMPHLFEIQITGVIFASQDNL